MEATKIKKRKYSRAGCFDCKKRKIKVSIKKITCLNHQKRF